MTRDEEGPVPTHPVTGREAALMKALTLVASVTGVTLDKAMTVLEDLVSDGWTPPGERTT
jgi:hypothetical protein